MVCHMTTITLPISKDLYIPNLPKMNPRDLNWMGRFVDRIRDAENYGSFYRVYVYALTIFTSMLMVISIVLSPLFIYGFKEYIRQCERARFDKEFDSLHQMATEHGRQLFNQGRIAPLKTIDISLSGSQRDQMIKKLGLEKAEAQNHKDIDLLQMVACKDDDYLSPYGLTIQ